MTRNLNPAARANSPGTDGSEAAGSAPKATTELEQVFEVLETWECREISVSEAYASILAIAKASAPSNPTRAEAVAWRVEYRMPNGVMAGTQLFGSKAAVDFARQETSQTTTVTPLYAAPPSTEEGGGLREALETAIALLWEHCSGLGPRIKPLEQALARDGGKTA